MDQRRLENPFTTSSDFGEDHNSTDARQIGAPDTEKPKSKWQSLSGSCKISRNFLASSIWRRPAAKNTPDDIHRHAPSNERRKLPNREFACRIIDIGSDGVEEQ